MVGALALHGEQHDRVAVGVTLPRHLRRLGHDGDGQRDGLVGRLEHEAGLQGPAVFSPCNERDVEAALEEAGADRPADGTGTYDDEAHEGHCKTCQAFAVASLNPVERAAALGGSVAAVPLRLVGRPGRAGPRRHGAQRAARHRHQG